MTERHSRHYHSQNNLYFVSKKDIHSTSGYCQFGYINLCSLDMIFKLQLTRLSWVADDGIRGRWNFFWDPQAPGSGGDERLAAARLMASIHFWQSSLLLRQHDINRYIMIDYTYHVLSCRKIKTNICFDDQIKRLFTCQLWLGMRRNITAKWFW